MKLALHLMVIALACSTLTSCSYTARLIFFNHTQEAVTVQFLVDADALQKRPSIYCDPILARRAVLEDWYDHLGWQSGQAVGQEQIVAKITVSIVVPPDHALLLCQSTNDDFSQSPFPLKNFSMLFSDGGIEYHGVHTSKAFRSEERFIWLAQP